MSGVTRAERLKRALEALLFAADEALTRKRLEALLPEYRGAEIEAALRNLAAEIRAQGRVYALVEIAGGYRFLTRPEYAEVVARLRRTVARERLSPAALETLAVVAYKEPVMKAEIDAIRGVNSEGTLQSLLKRRLVRVVGRADVLGRPLLYGVTREFLDQFGLRSRDELPRPEEVLARLEKEEGGGAPPPPPAAGEEKEDDLLREPLPEVPEVELGEEAAGDGGSAPTGCR